MLEKIIAEMPRVLSDYATYHFKACRDGDLQPCTGCLADVWDEATEAQCKLLAKQGYRPAPEWMGIIHKIKTLRADWTEYVSKPPCIYLSEEAFIAKELRRWLLEGE